MVILVYLQQLGKTLHPVSLEIASKAVELASQSGMSAHGVFAGNLAEISPKVFAQTGLSCIYTLETRLPVMTDTAVSAVLCCLEQINPEILLFGATLEGRAIAPTVAAHCHSGVTADCTSLSIDENGLLIQTRPAFSGSVMADIITPTTRPQIATVRAGIFPFKKNSHYYSEMVRLDSEKIPPSIHTLISAAETPETQITDSEHIIAIGAGFTKRELLPSLEESCVSRGISLLCSRALIERGWMPQNRQIGLSGKCITAKTLVTLGISGSVQFLSGITAVKHLVAVNTDPYAPIMKRAQIPILADIYEILPFFQDYEHEKYQG